MTKFNFTKHRQIWHLRHPGSAQTSLIWTRMNAAEETVRMPPIATHVIDANGLALIGDWINAMENP